MAKKVLGKGLSAIISSSATPIDALERGLAEEKERIVLIEVDKIKPNPDQPRRRIDNSGIQGLAESIQSVGLLQPIIVRREGNKFFVVAGERRLTASKIAGLKKIESIIIDASEEENLTMALIENVQRSDLNPIEEAGAYKVLMSRFKLKQQEIAERVGKERATISNLLRLLNLPVKIQSGIAEGSISVGHAKLLLTVSGKRQEELYNEIIRKGLSVRALEEVLTSDKKTTVGSRVRLKTKDPQIKDMEDMLISILGTKVEIKHSGNRGKIEINYYSLDDFERIIELLK
jgi:ParB family chromosome partitioning protein